MAKIKLAVSGHCWGTGQGHQVRPAGRRDRHGDGTDLPHGQETMAGPAAQDRKRQADIFLLGQLLKADLDRYAALHDMLEGVYGGGSGI
jgi:hypothetical protein